MFQNKVDMLVNLLMESSMDTALCLLMKAASKVKDSIITMIRDS